MSIKYTTLPFCRKMHPRRWTHGPLLLRMLWALLYLGGCSASIQSNTAVSEKPRSHRQPSTERVQLHRHQQKASPLGPVESKHPHRRVKKSQILRRGPAGTRGVALTFDDGPTRGTTPKILDILKNAKVKATFFMVGRNVRRNPDLARRAVQEGHLVANHTWDHPHQGSTDDWRQQIHHTEVALFNAGVKPSLYFRPAHGIINPKVVRASSDLGYTIVLYTLLSSDWERPGVQALTKQVVWRATPGGILVLHDGSGDRSQTIEALPKIIEGLRRRGLEPIRLDHLLDRPGGDLSHAPPSTSELRD